MITMVQTKKLSITYVFGDGRSKHILSRENFAKEFFYGFFEFQDEFKNIDFIEFSPKNKKSFIANKIAEIILDKLSVNDRNFN